MDKESSLKSVSLTSSFPILFRYIILCVLYIYIFVFFYSNSAQFFLFIGVFILNFFTFVFLLRDFLNIKNIAANIFSSQSLLPEQKNSFTILFLIAIFLTLIIQFVSLILILVVFDYGKNTTNNNNIYELTVPNSLLLNKYKIIITITTSVVLFFSVLIAIANLDIMSTKLLITIVGCLISAGLIIMSAIGLTYAVNFLDVKTKIRALYK